MTWLADGSQTGVDTLAGSEINPSVTPDPLGVLTDYDLNSTQLFVNGTVTIDPRIERVKVSAYPTMTNLEGIITVNSGGTLKLGVDTSAGGITTYTPGDVITSGIIVGSGAVACCGIWHLIDTLPGSTLEMYGVTIVSATYWRTRGNLKVRSAAWVNITTQALQLRIDSTAEIDVDGITIENASIIFSAPLTPTSKFKGFVPINSAITLSDQSVNNASPQDQKPLMLLSDIDDSLSSRPPFSFWQKSWGGVLSNLARGGLTNAPSGASATSYGMIEQDKDFSFLVKDAAGVVLESAKVFIPLYNFSQPITTTEQDFHLRSWAEKSYSATTDAAGEAEIDALLYKIVHAMPSQVVQYVYLEKDGSGVGRVDVRVKSYGKLIAVIPDVSCDLVGRKLVEASCFDDTQTTETDKSVVDAYTSVDNAAEFFDVFDSYKTDNFLTDGSLGSIVQRVDNTINAGSYDVTIDATAVSVRDIISGALVVKSSNFAGNIITTGTVTLDNGATVSGFIDDSAGITTIVEIT